MCFPLSWASAGWEEENLHGSMPHIDRSIPGVCEGTDLFMGLFLLPAEIPLKEPLWSPRVGWFGPDIGCLCGRFWCGRSVLCVTRNKACRSQTCPPSAPLHARVQGGEEVLGAPTRSVGEPPLSPAFSIRVTIGQVFAGGQKVSWLKELLIPAGMPAVSVSELRVAVLMVPLWLCWLLPMGLRGHSHSHSPAACCAHPWDPDGAVSGQLLCLRTGIFPRA